jgi:hypothetical protein
MTDYTKKPDKGDMFGAILYYSNTAQSNEPKVFSDYPETLLFTLKTFYNTWSLPELAIPAKRKKSAFSEWVYQLTDLKDLCGSEDRILKAFTMAHEMYESYSQKFIVYRPASIRGLVITALSQMNAEAKVTVRKQESVPEVLVVSAVATSEVQQTAVKNLKRMLKDESND